MQLNYMNLVDMIESILPYLPLKGTRYHIRVL